MAGRGAQGGLRLRFVTGPALAQVSLFGHDKLMCERIVEGRVLCVVCCVLCCVSSVHTHTVVARRAAGFEDTMRSRASPSKASLDPRDVLCALPMGHQFPCPRTGHQMMLVSDMVLLWDANFRKHLEAQSDVDTASTFFSGPQAFAEDAELLKEEFGEVPDATLHCCRGPAGSLQAFKKLTELGCPWSKERPATCGARS